MTAAAYNAPTTTTRMAPRNGGGKVALLAAEARSGGYITPRGYNGRRIRTK